jgi:chromosome segregation ATPase
MRKIEDDRRKGSSTEENAKVSALMEENSQLQAEVIELRRSNNIDKLSKRVNELTSSLAKEKAMKEEAVNSLKASQVQLKELNTDLVTVKETTFVQDAAVHSEMHKKIEVMRLEVGSMNKEATSLRMELKSANHHRDVLRDTIEHLEKQLKTTADALAEAKVQSYSRNKDTIETSEEVSACCRDIVRQDR